MSGGRTPSRRRSVPKGFTVVELLFALAITALIALTTLTMLAALSAATQSTEDIRRSSVRRQIVSARLGALLRSSARVLAKGNRHLVLWMGDLNGDGRPAVSEIQRVEWDPDINAVVVYRSPSDLAPAADVAYELDEDFDAATTTLIAQGLSFEGVPFANDIEACRFSVVEDPSYDSNIVHIALSMSTPKGTFDYQVVSAPRVSAPK